MPTTRSKNIKRATSQYKIYILSAALLDIVSTNLQHFGFVALSPRKHHTSGSDCLEMLGFQRRVVESSQQLLQNMTHHLQVRTFNGTSWDCKHPLSIRWTSASMDGTAPFGNESCCEGYVSPSVSQCRLPEASQRWRLTLSCPKDLLSLIVN